MTYEPDFNFPRKHFPNGVLAIHKKQDTILFMLEYDGTQLYLSGLLIDRQSAFHINSLIQSFAEVEVASGG